MPISSKILSLLPFVMACESSVDLEPGDSIQKASQAVDIAKPTDSDTSMHVVPGAPEWPTSVERREIVDAVRELRFGDLLNEEVAEGWDPLKSLKYPSELLVPSVINVLMTEPGVSFMQASMVIRHLEHRHDLVSLDGLRFLEKNVDALNQKLLSTPKLNLSREAFEKKLRKRNEDLLAQIVSAARLAYPSDGADIIERGRSSELVRVRRAAELATAQN